MQYFNNFAISSLSWVRVESMFGVRISDGRVVRPLDGRFTQERMFGLHKSGLFDPAIESILTVKELDDVLNVSEAYKALGSHWWRSDRYAGYRKGFEKELDKRIGNDLT